MSDQGQDQRQSCSINGKLCINGIRADFENDPLTQRPRPCNKWVRLIGRNPQTGQDIDEWCCNEWAKVKIGIEGCQMTRHATASVDKVANEVTKGNESFAVFVSAGLRQIENKKDHNQIESK
jgi:hypothetical protein